MNIFPIKQSTHISKLRIKKIVNQLYHDKISVLFIQFFNRIVFKSSFSRCLGFPSNVFFSKLVNYDTGFIYKPAHEFFCYVGIKPLVKNVVKYENFSLSYINAPQRHDNPPKLHFPDFLSPIITGVLEHHGQTFL